MGARRGGYCFEHVTLFAAVLEAVGFRPLRHTARVVVFVPRAEVPRTHMFLTVRLDGQRFVVDPGFGPFASPAPLPLRDADAAPPPDASHWMAHDGAEWAMYLRLPDRIAPGWITTLEAENPIDFELANHFTAIHPHSPFVNRVMLSTVTPNGRISVMNRDVTIVRDGAREVSQLPDRAALRSLLTEHFGFDLPEVERLRVPSIPEWH